MIGTCPALGSVPGAGGDAGLIAGLFGSVDCAADTLLASGYAALAAPGGPVAAALTGALTLFVGFYGYGLLLGRTRLDVNASVVALVKIGLVLVLAGNWAIYQQVVAHTLFDAPGALADLILGGVERQGAVLSAEPLVALQQVFDELVRDVRSLGSHAGTVSPLLGGPAFATMMLNASAYTIVLSGAGVLAATRIGLALFLALGPVVAGFLLFAGTRGLVEGWLRAMIALSLVALTTTVLLSIELTVIEPALLLLARQRAADAITPEAALGISLVVGVFLLAKAGAIAGATMFARGLTLPGRAALVGAQNAAPIAAPTRVATGDTTSARVVRLAEAAAAADRRAPAMRTVPSDLRLGDSLIAADRLRTQGSAGVATVAAGHALHHTPRAVRPRRELLVSRRNR